MKVGDVVTATITVTDDGNDTPSLTSGTINGFTLGSFAKTNNTTYTVQFTIANGGTDRATGDAIPVANLVLTDAAENASLVYSTPISQAGDPIDANRPNITGVGIPDVPMIVGDIVTATLTVANDAGDTPALISGTIAGFPLGNFVYINPTTYTVQFTITNGGTDYSAASDIPVSSLVLTDLSGNSNTTTDFTISQAGDPIDANRPTASISGTNTICADGNTNISISLTGNAPWNIVYQRDGTNDVPENGIVTSPYIFNTNIAGTYSVFSVEESTGNIATSMGGTATVTVNSLPVITTLDLKPLYNYEDAPDTLHPVPAGGTYSGIGIVASSNTFHPNLAGIGGPYTITYTYTDGNGCTNSKVATTQVVAAGGSINGFNPPISSGGPSMHCYDENTFSISATSGAGGTANAFYGPGVTAVTDSTGWFDPRLAGDGTHTITYEYIKDFVLFTITKEVIVDSVGKVDFITLADGYCVTSPLVNLTVLAPPGGTNSWSWSGEGVGFSGGTGRTTTLQPTLIDPGTYNITYQYTSTKYTSSGGCRADTTKTFDINPLPIVYFTPRPIFNLDEIPVLLTGTPAGGHFSGTGVSADGKFTPKTAGLTLNIYRF
jgi:hypothetical protein